MKVLETIEAETQFTPGQHARLEADLQLVQAFSQRLATGPIAPAGFVEGAIT